MDADEISVTEAAKLLGVTPHAVRALIHAGRLPARRFSTVYVLRLSDVQARLREMEGRGKPGRKPTGAT